MNHFFEIRSLISHIHAEKREKYSSILVQGKAMHRSSSILTFPDGGGRMIGERKAPPPSSLSRYKGGRRGREALPLF